jgi:phytoene desaturase
MKKAIVVGAGLGGISAALRLKAQGHQVCLVDRLNQLGGRARVFRQDGFSFDAGPTVITAPFLIDELFELFGKKTKDYIEVKEVEPWYRFEFNDGSTFDYGGTLEDTLAEIDKLSPEDKEGYKKLLEKSRQIFDIGFTKLSSEPFHSFFTLLREVPQMLKLRADRSVYQLISRYLKDDRLRRAFSIQPLLVGGNPFDTTCIYNLIHYLERQWGIHYVMGGTAALVNAFGRLMQEEGIEIRLDSEVIGFEGDETLKSAVLKDGQKIEADFFVCNAEPAFVYENLVPKSFNKKWNSWRINRLEFSMGLFVLYFGTHIQYEDVKHHTILMGDSYEGLLDSIFNKKELRYDDMSLYLHRPTATDPQMAPPGCDSFYVLSPVPNLKSGIDWSKETETYKQKVYEKLESRILPNLRKHLATERVLTPKEFKSDYHAHLGSGFSVAPKFSQSAYFRFHNKSENFKNLFFVGAGTHPGAGIPGVMSSSKVLDRLVS